MELFSDASLSTNQMYAVGQYVLDDLMKQAFEKTEATEEKRLFFKTEFEKLLQEECPGLILKTPLVFRPNIGFFKKDKE